MKKQKTYSLNRENKTFSRRKIVISLPSTDCPVLETVGIIHCWTRCLRPYRERKGAVCLGERKRGTHIREENTRDDTRSCGTIYQEKLRVAFTVSLALALQCLWKLNIYSVFHEEKPGLRTSHVHTLFANAYNSLLIIVAQSAYAWRLVWCLLCCCCCCCYTISSI